MTEYARRTRRIARILTSLVEESVEAKKYQYSRENPVADAFLRHEPFALLVGVIADQMVVASRAWVMPYVLCGRLGHLDPCRIARMNEAQLETVIRKGGSLHRFPRTMARWIIQAARRVRHEYQGRTELIWVLEPTAAGIDRRLRAFNGISQKKATMFTKILVRDEYAKPTDLWSIDLPYDVHIRRVLLRAGLAGSDTVQNIVSVGRKLNPRYPGLLDDALWLIGRRHCHANKPNHQTCPLRRVCPQLRRNASTA